MNTLNVVLGDRSYPIYIGRNLLDREDIFTSHVSSSQILIVTNSTVAPIYLNKIAHHFRDRQCHTLILPDGEEYKTLDSAKQVFDILLEQKFNRNAHIIALGGGVIGDLSGFAAACYQRGIPFIQVPTTLLAQVDSSVGGKTAVNHPLGKNMIGSFYQPKCVVADTASLDTLPDRELAAGLAEVVKYGLIRDPVFFEWLENNIDLLLVRDSDALTFAIERSCANKAEVVGLDERESGLRATLNLGHTFGHAIEAGLGYGETLHGEAVAIGMCQAADLSRRLGWLSDSDVNRVVGLLKKAGLPVTPPASLSTDRFIELMAVDKKNLEGQTRLILLKRIGEATLPMSVDLSLLSSTLKEYGRF